MYKKGTISCFIAALFFFFTISQLTIFNAINPYLAKELSLSEVNIGLLSSTYLYANAIFLIPAGVFLDYLPIRRIILVFMILCSSTSLIFCYSNSVPVDTVLRGLQGAGE